MRMVVLAAVEVVAVFTWIILFIWRLQFTFPDFALFLLGFLVLTFFIHRNGVYSLGIGSRGLISGLRTLAAPTAILAVALILVGVIVGELDTGSITEGKLWG